MPTPELGLTNRPWQLSELNQQHHAAGSQIEEHAPARGADGGGGDGTRIGNFLAGVKTWMQQATGTQRDSRLEAARRIENFVQRDTHTNRLDLSNLGLSDLPPNFKLLAQVSQLRHALPDLAYIQLEGNAFDAQTQALLPNLQAECHGRLGFGGGRIPARAVGVQPVRSHQDNAKHCRALLEVMDAVQTVTLPRFTALCQSGVDVAGTMALNETILRTTAQYNTLVNKLNSKISRHANLKINATCLKAQPGRTVLFNLEQLAHHGSELRKLSDTLAAAKPGFFGSKTGVKAAQELLIQLQKVQYEAEKTCEVVELVSSGLRNIASAQSDLEDKLFESEIDAIRNQLQSTPINEVLENALEHVVHADALVSTRHQALLALRQQVAAALAELSRCDSSQPTIRAAQQWLDQTEGNVAALHTEKNLLMAVSKLANPNTARLMLNYSTTTLTKAVKELPSNSPYLTALLQHHQKQIRNLVTSRPDYVEPPPPPALWTTLPKVSVKHTLMAQYSLQSQAFDAVRTGDLQKLHGLLQQGVNPQAQDNDGNTLLHAAAMREQRDTIRFLVSTQGVDLHASNKQGKTPFLAAFEAGQDETAAMLEDLGASPDTPVYWRGRSALLQAAATGNLADLDRLLKLKANAHATDDFGDKAIHLAARLANPETLIYCQQELGQKLEEPGFNGQTPLLRAAAQGKVDNMKWLLAQKANAHATDDFGDMAIHLAAAFANPETLIYCQQELGQKLEEPGFNGQTPLLRATAQGKVDNMKWLLAQKANAHATDNNDNKAIHLAVSFSNPETLNYCQQELGQKLEEPGMVGRTPLLQAAAHGKVENMTWLLAQKVNAHATDSEGNKAIHLAACFANPETLIYCQQELGQKLEEPGLLGRTPLLQAAAKGKVENMTWLLAQKVNAHATDSEGNKAIHLAACFANRETLIYCQQELGQKLEEPGFNGQTPLLQAAAKGKVENMTWLLAQKVNAHGTDSEGNKAIHLAACFANPETLIYCQQELGQKLEEPGFNGQTPLLQAAAKGKVENMTWLLAQKVNAHGTDSEGNKAIHLAACFANRETLIYCQQELGQKLEEPGLLGRTPLLQAAAKGKVDNMTWLLAQGANAHATDRHGKKAIDLALAFNKPDAVALCRQWGQ